MASRLLNALVLVGTLVAYLPSIAAQSQNQGLNFEIYEEFPPNTFISDIPTEAKFKETYSEEEWSQFRYSIIEQNSEHTEYFSIDNENGILRTAQVIDRDAICPQKDSCTIKLDIAIQPRDFFQIIKVTVDILDINDNSPTFLQTQMTKTIPENTPVGTSIPISTADDIDSPKYGVKRYEMTTGGPTFELKITNNSGIIDLHLVLLEPVDREVRELYKAVVVAYDSGVPPKSGTLTVDVTIQDVNDNDPTFEQEIYRATVPEDMQPNSVIITVRANDPDFAENGEIVYGFDDRTSHMYNHLFLINNATGQITLGTALNFEDQEVYNLAVTARDKSPESLTANAKVIIQVEDVNDHAPEIRINALTDTGAVEIAEGEPVGTFVAYVTVADPDSGRNGDFSCDLEGDAFTLQQLDTEEFKIVTAVELDREAQATYDAVFICADSSDVPKTSSVEIPVSILDQNDNSPVFSKQTYSVVLEENNAIGAFLVQVTATDDDVGANGLVQYRAAEGEAANVLHVDANSGNITTKVSFDYEKADRLEYIIIASDHGKPSRSASATLLLKLTDIDDVKPEFSTNHYEFDVYENQPEGTEVGQLVAFDNDSAPFNEFLFFLDPTTGPVDRFVVEPQSGKIYTSQPLDREITSEYELVAMAIAKNTPDMTSRAAVKVYVADQNDNEPIVDFPNNRNNTVYMTSRTNQGQALTFIIAHDADIGINGQLTYKIVKGNEESIFSVNEHTGLVSLQKSLANLELDAKIYQLMILVTDNGYPQHAVEVMLNIVVNKSAELPPSGNQNLTIVISVVTVSALLTMVLVVAIIVVRRIDKRPKKQSHMDKAPRPIPFVVSTDKQNNLKGLDGRGSHMTGYANDVSLEDERQISPKSGLSSSQSELPPQQQNHSNENKVNTTYVSFSPSGSGAGYPYPSSVGGPLLTSSRHPSLDCHALACQAPSPRPSVSSDTPLRGGGGGVKAGVGGVKGGATGAPPRTNHHLHHAQHQLQAQHGLHEVKDADSESNSSQGALSNTDSGRGSNEETESAEHSALSHSREDALPTVPPRMPSVQSESFTARLSSVIQNQQDHLQDRRHSSNQSPLSHNHYSHKQPSNNHPSNNHPSNNHRLPHNSVPHSHKLLSSNLAKSDRLKQPSSSANQRLPQKQAANHRLPHNSKPTNHKLSFKDSHGNPSGSRGNHDSSWAEDDSEPEYSDEDMEHVYYVNASQV